MHVAAILAQGQSSSCFFPLLVFSSGTKQDGYLRTASLPTALVLRSQLRPLTECALSQPGFRTSGSCARSTVLRVWYRGAAATTAHTALALSQRPPGPREPPGLSYTHMRPGPGASPADIATHAIPSEFVSACVTRPRPVRGWGTRHNTATRQSRRLTPDVRQLSRICPAAPRQPTPLYRRVSVCDSPRPFEVGATRHNATTRQHLRRQCLRLTPDARQHSRTRPAASGGPHYNMSGSVL